MQKIYTVVFFFFSFFSFDFHKKLTSLFGPDLSCLDG